MLVVRTLRDLPDDQSAHGQRQRANVAHDGVQGGAQHFHHEANGARFQLHRVPQVDVPLPHRAALYPVQQSQLLHVQAKSEVLLRDDAVQHLDRDHVLGGRVRRPVHPREPARADQILYGVLGALGPDLLVPQFSVLVHV